MSNTKDNPLTQGERQSQQAWPILGLPFDAVSMSEAMERIYRSVDTGAPLFISTPNVNFAIMALSDPGFRQSVLNSDLSIPDGMPLIWIARLLGYPIRERVAGSGLLEQIIVSKTRANKPVRLFFFGGAEGAAEVAHHKLNVDGLGVRSVGYYYPGFGSIEDMSADTIIHHINDCEPDFIVVALGAKKGQAWIERNRRSLTAPVISHLGAAVNFVAGTASRAPRWIQGCGLEWAWRIKEEPSLWRRYLNDGLGLGRIFITRIIPLALHIRHLSRSGKDDLVLEITGNDTLIIKGGVSEQDLDAIQQGLATISTAPEPKLDLGQIGQVPASFIGLLMRLASDDNPVWISCWPDESQSQLRAVLRLYNAEYLLPAEQKSDSQAV